MRIYPGTTVDYEFKSLRDLGWRGALNDMQFAHLRANGFLGSLPDMFKSFASGPVNTITGTAPALAPLINLDTLSSKVTWGSYSGSGTVTTTKWMKLNAGSWVSYVGSTVVNTGELWQVRELCTDNITTNWPFESVARTVTVAATVPATITVGQWTLANSPSAGADTLTVTLTALPSDGGSTITSYEYRRNGGTATALGGGVGTGARNITVVASTLANIEIRAVNGIGNGAWSDTKSATPTTLGLYAARFGIGSEQGSSTGAFDTNLYTGTKPANGTYGNFSVTSGVITPNGSQTAGSFTVDNWPVTVTSGYVAVANQTQWDALTAGSISGKTVLVREGIGISCSNTWNNNSDFGWATIKGDGDDPQLTDSSGNDSRKHFVTFQIKNCKKLILDNLRIVTGSVAGAKVIGVVVTKDSTNSVSNVHITNCLVIASRPDPFGDYSGGVTTFPGDEGIAFTGGSTSNISVRDCKVVGSAGNPAAIAMHDATGYNECIGNWVDLFYLDGVRQPNIPALFGGNLMTRPMASNDVGDPHCDAVQFLGAQAVIEASAFIENSSRGVWQSVFSQDGNTSATIRNIFVSENTLYGISINDTIGSQIKDCTWVPDYGAGFPLSNPQGGIRFEDVISGTNDITNSVFRRSSSIIHASVTETGNVDAQSWVSADWTTAFPNWQMSTIPTLQDALQYHALPSGGGAAAGKGASQNITSWGTKRSSYVLNVTTPTVSSITLTPTTDGFTGTLRTDVGNNMVYYCVIPQAQGNPTWREIKEQRVSNGVCYGSVWCGRASTGTDLSISGNTATSGTAYKFVAVAENGWSKQSAITTSNFTTASAGITRIGVGATANVVSTTINVPVPTVSNGDYLVIFLAHRSVTNTVTTPSGWTLIGTGTAFTGGDSEIRVYGRVRDGSEGSSVTVTTNTSHDLLAFCAGYRTVSGVGNTASSNGFNQTNRNTPTLTATAQSCILHVWTCSGGADTQTMPNAGDLVAQVYKSDNTWWLGAENQLSVSAGTTAARNTTSTGGPNWNTMQIELLKA